MGMPQLSPEQRRAALAQATTVRRERGALLAQLKAGELALQTVLERRADTVFGKIRVRKLLESLPGVGPVRAERTMSDLNIAQSRRVQGLGAIQREKLLAYFPPKS
ncbi:integration host factor, actinobacterial type [Streptomyces sp. MS2.AVA.5]|uniref:Integration host factor, actinobacterial type n=1 Tax=Streptomyces achmelvichensis TaxID=3134111 RepID=A0ACC6PM29_9ACTN